MLKVAYYAHHQGSGHVRDALNVAANPDLDVLIMASAPVAGAPAVFLENDAITDYPLQMSSPFPYSPVGNDSVRRRFVQIHDALTAFNPDVVIVDVSIEVASFARLCGYPTVIRRLHGDRNDLAHHAMYAMADAVIAYFPEALEQSDYAEAWQGKTAYMGMPSMSAAGCAVEANTVAVLTSLGGGGVKIEDINTAARITPHWRWRVVGVTDCVGEPASNVELVGVVDDPSDLLARSAVIVSSGGHNALRSVAAARRPIILMPEDRLFNEQQRFTESIAKETAIAVFSGWNVDWPSALSHASRQDVSLLSDALFVDYETFHRNTSAALSSALGR